MAYLQINPFILVLLVQFINTTIACPPGWKSFLDKDGYKDCFLCRDCPDGITAIVNCTNEHDTICEKCTEDQYYRSLHCQTCTVCEAGFYVARNCSEFKDTECDACPDGHYSLVQNSSNCLECTDCNGTIIQDCNRTSDTVCKQNEEKHGLPTKEKQQQNSIEVEIGLFFVGSLISCFPLMYCCIHARCHRKNRQYDDTVPMGENGTLMAEEIIEHPTISEFKRNLAKKLKSMMPGSSDGPYAIDDEPYAKFNMISRTPVRHMPSKVKYIKDIFFESETASKRICVIGDASIGKTALCRRFVCAFCSNIISPQDTPRHGDDREYVEVMRGFDFLFYISLRNCRSLSSVRDMIKNHYFQNSEHSYQQIFDGGKRVLVVLDGLDQWMIPGDSKERKLTNLSDLQNCTVLITTRPCAWKQYHPSEILEFDRKITMKNITKQAAHNLKDASLDKWRKVKNRKEDEPKFDDARIMSLPFLLKQIVKLWCKENIFQSDEQMFKIIETVLLHLLKSTESFTDETLNHEIDFQDCLHPDMKKHKLLLSLLGKVSYINLPVHDSHSSVFSFKTLHDSGLSKNMITYCLEVGILTKDMDNCVRPDDVTLSFPHRIYQDFFASIFLISNSNAVQELCNKLKTLDDILNVRFVVIFLCGMVPSVAETVFNRLNQILNCEDSVDYDEESLQDVQSMLLDSAIENESIDFKLRTIYICLETLDEERKHLLGQLIDSTITSSMYFIHKLGSKSAATTNTLLTSLLKCPLKSITLRLGKNLAKKTKDMLLKIINNDNTILTKYELRGKETRPFLSYLKDDTVSTLLKLGISGVEVDHTEKQALMTYVAKAVNLQGLVLMDIKCKEHDQHCPCSLELQESSQMKRLLLKDVQIKWVRVNTTNLTESNIDTGTTVFYFPEKKKFKSSTELKLQGLRYLGSEDLGIKDIDSVNWCDVKFIADLLPNFSQLSLLKVSSFNFGNTDICLSARATGLKKIEFHNVSMATDKLVNFINSIPSTEHEISCVFENFTDSEKSAEGNFELNHFVNKISKRFEVTNFEKFVPTGVSIKMKTKQP